MVTNTVHKFCCVVARHYCIVSDEQLCDNGITTLKRFVSLVFHDMFTYELDIFNAFLDALRIAVHHKKRKHT